MMVLLGGFEGTGMMATLSTTQEKRDAIHIAHWEWAREASYVLFGTVCEIRQVIVDFQLGLCRPSWTVGRAPSRTRGDEVRVDGLDCWLQRPHITC